MVMRETLDGLQGGLQIGGRMITNLRYADDIILLATVSEILTLKILRGHVTLNASPYSRSLTCMMPVLFIFNLETKFEMSRFIHSKLYVHLYE